jgi:hypothetical protein
MRNNLNTQHKQNKDQQQISNLNTWQNFNQISLFLYQVNHSFTSFYVNDEIRF